MKLSISEEKQRSARVIGFALLCVVCLHILFMALSGKHPLSDNPYDSFLKQALSWLQGRLDLGENYGWLELAEYGGKYYVSFPPFPSYVLLPFALVFGEQTPDSLLAFLVMLIGVCYSAKIALHFRLSEFACVFFAVFLYAANNLWQITVDGWVWFFAQNLSFTLSLMSFYYALSGQKGRSYFCLAAAVGCRPFQVIYLPVICIILYQKQPGKDFREKTENFIWKRPFSYLPAAILVISYLVLNVLRFGEPFEFGHNYLPEFINSKYGQFSLHYVWDNLQKLFRLPVLNAVTGKIETFGFDGINVFTVYPLLILFIVLFFRRLFVANAQRRAYFRLVLPTLVLCTVHVFFFLMHKTMGGAHFGNRYIADVMPVIYVLSVLSAAPSTVKKEGSGEPKGRITLFHLLCALLFLSGLVFNFTGVLEFYNRG